MRTKSYSKKRMFGLLLLPFLACSVADGVSPTSVRAASYNVTAPLTTSAFNLTGTDFLTVTNAGSIVVDTATAVYVDGAATGVTIDNSGTISGLDGYLGIRVDPFALDTTITNQAGGLISAENLHEATGIVTTAMVGPATAIAMPGIAAGNLLTNAGTIAASVTASAAASDPTAAMANASAGGAYAVVSDGDLAGTLNNSGTISGVSDASATAEAGMFAMANASGRYVSGLYLNGDIAAGGELLNSGEICANVTSTAVASGVSAANAYAYGYTAYGLDMDGLSGTLDNSGTISGALDISATATGGSAYAYASGAYVSGLYLDGDVAAGGELLNSGEISATVTSTAVASGVSTANANAYGYYAYGLDMDSLYGTFDNSGTISGALDVSATATGAYANASASGYTVTGLLMDNIEADASLSNSGAITASVTASAVADGVTSAYAFNYYVYGAYAAYMGDISGTFDNSGEISASLNGTATATAAGNGTTGYAVADILYASNATALELYDIETGGKLLNSGTISASIDAAAIANGTTYASAYVDYAEDAYGIDMDYLYGTLDNSGTISASIDATATAAATDGDAYASVYEAYYAYGIDMYSIEAGGQLLNSGEISAAINATAVAQGITSASATVRYASDAWGIDMDSLYGTLDNSGTISASIDATATATATGNGTTGYAFASISYASEAYGLGMYSIEAGGKLLNSGTISASIDAAATANGTTYADAYVYAEYAYGIDMDSLYGTLDNSGTISASIDAAATATATNGYASASVDTAYSAYGIYDMNSIEAGASLTNSGTISAAITATATAIGGTNADAYVDDAEYAYGIEMDYLYGTLDNSGTIRASIDATATATASDGDAYASVYDAYYVYGIDMYSIEAGGQLLNSGEISAAINAAAVAQGITSASATVRYASDAYGIDMAYLYGTLDNSGTISAGIDATATATATGNGTTGYASASVSASSAYGLDMYSIEAGGKLLNSGTISAAITATATATGSTSADAYVDYADYAYGIDMDSLYGTLDNSGTISASIDATATAAATDGDAYARVYDAYFAFGIEMSNIEAGGQLLNSGEISAAINAAAVAQGANASAVVSYATDVWGLNMGSLSGTLDNSGVISASIAASADATATDGGAYATVHDAYNVFGIDMDNLEMGVLLLNSGEISAAINATASAQGVTMATAMVSNASAVYGVEMSSLSGTLDNSGTISASIDAAAIAIATGNGTTGVAAADASAFDVHGVRLASIDTNGKLLNSNTISASASATVEAAGTGSAMATAWASAVGVTVYGTLAGALDNSGTISASAYASATATALTATANASSQAAGVYVWDLAGELVNSGMIEGSASQLQNGYSLAIETGTGLVDNQMGGLLRGNLFVGGSVAVANSGTISLPAMPAVDDGLNSIDPYVGAFIAGDYAQSAGGVLALDAFDTANYGQFGVGGTADFADGTTMHVSVIPDGSMVGGAVLDDVLVAGTLNLDETQLNVTSSSALMSFAPEVDADGYLDLYASNVAITTASGGLLPKSAFGAAGVLDGLLADYPTGSGLDDFLTQLRGYGDGADVARGVTETLPSLNVMIPEVALGVVAENMQLVSARQQGVRGINSGDGIVSDGNAWGKLYGSWAEQDSGGGYFGYDADTVGLILGADAEFGAGSRIGAALSYAQTDVDGDTWAKQTADIDSYLLMLYGSVGLDRGMTLNWQAGYGQGDTDIKRQIPTSEVVAKGSFDTDIYTLGVGVDRTYRLSEQTTFIPTVRVDYTMADSESYDEKGAGELSLAVKSHDVDELIFGVDGLIVHALRENLSVTANVGLGYDALADRGSVNAAYAGAPGLAFKVAGTDRDEFVYRAGVGAVLGSEEAVNVTARYDLEGRENFVNQSVSLKLNLPF